MARLFALDQNFPQPIVKVLQDFQTDEELVPLGAIDPRMAELDDWQLLLAMHTTSNRGTDSSRPTAASSSSRWSSRC